LRVLIFVFVFCTSIFSQDLNSIISTGDSLYNGFNIYEAFKYYQKAYETAPQNYQSLLNISKIYNAAGELKRRESKPDTAEAYFNKAIKLSEKFIKFFPDSSLAYTYSAISYGNLARFVGGKERLTYAKKIETNAKKAIEMDSSNALPYIVLGAYFREIARLSWIERTFANILYGSVPDGSYEDSEKMLKKALKINPKIITANFQMALTYRAMDKVEQEKEYFNKVLSFPLYDFRDQHLKNAAKRILSSIR
jgi:tetratricopeptide (TPR) repeat protein